ncbi:hypothetical protein CPB83DRAFT_851412, partial [Crepidotus variabilis]
MVSWFTPILSCMIWIVPGIIQLIAVKYVKEQPTSIVPSMIVLLNTSSSGSQPPAFFRSFALLYSAMFMNLADLYFTSSSTFLRN